MPRALTEAEREKIRARLLDAGGESFARYGLKKTTVEELAHAAGIAKGTFYHFFASKEALYVQVLLQQLPRLVQRLLDRSFRATSDINEALVRFQEELVALIEEDDLLRTVVTDPHEAASFLSADMDLRSVEALSLETFAPVIAEIREAQRRNEIVDGNPLEILMTLRMIEMLPFIKSQTDPELYPKLVTRMSRVVADGLTCPAKRKG